MNRSDSLPDQEPNIPSVATVLRDAIKSRALVYLGAYRAIKAAHGAVEATRIMRAASRFQGAEIGKSLARFAPRDFQGMAACWAMPPEEVETFKPDIRQLDDRGLEVQMMGCPLRETWEEMGCDDAEILELLHCASAFDEALLETAGFDFELTLWSPGQKGCCLTRIFERRVT